MSGSQSVQVVHFTSAFYSGPLAGPAELQGGLPGLRSWTHGRERRLDSGVLHPVGWRCCLFPGCPLGDVPPGVAAGLVVHLVDVRLRSVCRTLPSGVLGVAALAAAGFERSGFLAQMVNCAEGAPLSEVCRKMGMGPRLTAEQCPDAVVNSCYCRSLGTSAH